MSKKLIFKERFGEKLTHKKIIKYKKIIDALEEPFYHIVYHLYG